MSFTRYNDFRGRHRILEANGGGVAMVDFDRDGWPDLLFINGCRYPEQDDHEEYHDVLYRSLRGVMFDDVSSPSRLDSAGYHNGCAVGDLDNDGLSDLVITAVDGVALWLNNGDGTFSRRAAALPVLEPRWSTSVACADVNGDGQLDLYVANYIADDPKDPRLCRRPGSPDGFMQCSPTQFSAQDDWLLLGDGQGRWLDATTAAGINGVDGKGLGVVITDLTGDGRPDIYVANDGTPNFLYVQELSPAGELQGLPIPGFTESALLFGCAVNAAGLAEASMGVAAGDYNRDGNVDLHVTNFYLEPNVLYRNRQDRGFDDATIASRLGVYSRSSMGWGTVFCDADNDGWLDLLVANGHVDDYTWNGAGEPYAMAPQFFLNRRDGTFADVSAQCGDFFLRPAMGRGVASGDLNRDGRIDIVVNDTTLPAAMLLNESAGEQHWLTLHLTGTAPASNRSAIGSRVEIYGLGPVLLRTLDGGGSFQSAQQPLLHFGLGTTESVPRLTIRWPSGDVSEFQNVAVDREYAVVEGLTRMLSLSSQ